MALAQTRADLLIIQFALLDGLVISSMPGHDALTYLRRTGDEERNPAPT